MLLETIRAIRSFQFAACFKCFVSLNLSDIGSVFAYLCFNSLCRDLVETFKIIDQTKIRPCNTVFGEKDVQIKVFIRLVFMRLMSDTGTTLESRGR